MMLRPDPTGFTASTTILGELAHRLRPCAGHSSAQSDDQLDTVGVMQGSVRIEAWSDGGSLRPTEAPRYVRDILAVTALHQADLCEKAARSLARLQCSVASTLGVFAALPGTLKARVLDLIAQSVRPKRPWQVQRELGLPRPPPCGDESARDSRIFRERTRGLLWNSGARFRGRGRGGK